MRRFSIADFRFRIGPTSILIVSLAFSIFAAPLVSPAQQAAKVFRLGFLGVAPPTPQTLPIWEAFLEALRERGWVEGQNIVIERRFSEGRLERLAALADELVSLKVDVLVTVTTPAAQVVSKRTGTIPIVMITGDPVGSGLAASYARSGTNVTGLTHFSGEGFSSKLL